MMPPLIMPGKAWWDAVVSKVISRPFSMGKLRMRNPSTLAGPQPKQMLFGAWRSCTLGSGMLGGENRRVLRIRAATGSYGATPGVSFKGCQV